jgi:MFS family permease
MTLGIYASVAGAVGIIGGVVAGSLTLMIVGQAVAGVGFGASFTATLRLILPLAAVHQRAAVVAGIYVVSYTAFGVPVVIAGELIDAVGPVATVSWFSAVTGVFALIGLCAQLRLARNTPAIGETGPASLHAAGAKPRVMHHI